MDKTKKKLSKADYPQRLPVWNDPRMEIAGLRGTDLGSEIFAYLQNRNRIPEIERGRYLGEGVSGSFTSFADGMPKNLIELIYNAYPSTRQHEFAHAADHELARQYAGRPSSYSVPDTDTQFTRGYEKLVGGVRNATPPDKPNTRYTYQREDLANKLDEEWYKKHKRYRATNKELVGWGVGNQLHPLPEDRGPLHLDSTMATELSILLDLARREKQKK